MYNYDDETEEQAEIEEALEAAIAKADDSDAIESAVYRNQAGEVIQPSDEVPLPEQKQSMALVLIILQILGALPQIIEAAKKLWELIQGIRDRRTRAMHKFRFRQMVYGQRIRLGRRGQRKMSASDNDDMMRLIDKHSAEVGGILENQGG